MNEAQLHNTSPGLSPRTMRVGLAAFAFVAFCALAGPAYRFAYDGEWFEDERSERAIRRIERGSNSPEAPLWAGAYRTLSVGQRLWIGLDGDAVTYRDSPCTPQITDEGIGWATLQDDALIVEFPVLRRSWPRGRSMRTEYVACRFGVDVVLVEKAEWKDFEELLATSDDPLRDRTMGLLFREGRVPNFELAYQRLCNGGWQ